MANKHYDTTPMNKVEEQVKLEPCVQYVKDSWEKWDAHWSSKLSELEGFYNRWIGVPPTRNEEWQAQFHKKLTWQAEKTLVSRYHSALFPVSAPIDYDTTEVRDERQGLLGKSTVAHWFKVGKVSLEFLRGMRCAAIYGTALFEDDWYVRTERLPENVDKEVDDLRPMEYEGKALTNDDGSVRTHKVGTKRIQQEEWKRKVVEDRYRLKKANIFSWRIHPDKLDDDDDYPVIKQEFINYDTLMERHIEDTKMGLPGFDNLDKIREDNTKVSEEDKDRLKKDGTFFDEDNPNLEVLYYWGLYADKEEDGKHAFKKPMWIAVVNKKYRLFKRENPRWDKRPPLFRITWIEDEKSSYYGIGLAQIGASAEDRANNNVNIRTDMKKKIVKGTGWYNATDKKIKKTHLTNTTPGFMRPCSDPTKAFAYDNPPTLTPDDYKEEEVAVNDHREQTGATASLLPPADKKQQADTLGGMKLNLAQSLARLKPDLITMEMNGIRRIANRAFLLTRQNLKEPLWIELMASNDKLKQLGIQKIMQLDPRQIIGKVNFHCTGLSESLEKSQNIDKLIKVMEVSSKIPPVQMITDYAAIMKQIYLWLGIEEAEKFIRMNPELPLDSMQPQGQPGMPGQQGQPGQGGQPGGQPGQGGLPPEMLKQIASGLMQGQQGNQAQQAQPPQGAA